MSVRRPERMSSIFRVGPKYEPVDGSSSRPSSIWYRSRPGGIHSLRWWQANGAVRNDPEHPDIQKVRVFSPSVAG